VTRCRRALLARLLCCVRGTLHNGCCPPSRGDAARPSPPATDCRSARCVPLDTDLGFPSSLAFASAKFVTRHRRAAVLETKTSLDRAALVGEWWLAMRAAVLLTVLIATAAAATDPPAACG